MALKSNLEGKLLIGCFKVEEQLGQGSFGTVYKCFHTASKDHVAIKFMPERGDAVLELKSLNIFKAKRSKCEKLIEMLDIFSYRNLTCIVFPLYGPNTHDAMRKNDSRFELEDVREMAFQLIKATNFLHDNKIIHSDIKPKNILLNRHYYDQTNKSMYKKTNITLCDLGSVYEEEEFDTQVITTVPYRAFDVVLGFNIGYPCDVWSIGCTLFELFTKKRLFKANTPGEMYVFIEESLGPFTRA